MLDYFIILIGAFCTLIIVAIIASVIVELIEDRRIEKDHKNYKYRE